VGQIISGQVGKGILMLVVFFVLCGLGGLLNVVAAIDAYLIAEKKNAGKPVGEWDFF
jgi:TM2 domain-containing membrane protein YozV